MVKCAENREKLGGIYLGCHIPGPVRFLRVCDVKKTRNECVFGIPRGGVSFHTNTDVNVRLGK